MKNWNRRKKYRGATRLSNESQTSRAPIFGEFTELEHMDQSLMTGTREKQFNKNKERQCGSCKHKFTSSVAGTAECPNCGNTHTRVID